MLIQKGWSWVHCSAAVDWPPQVVDKRRSYVLWRCVTHYVMSVTLNLGSRLRHCTDPLQQRRGPSLGEINKYTQMRSIDMRRHFIIIRSKRKIQTWTGIRISDLRISSPRHKLWVCFQLIIWFELHFMLCTAQELKVHHWFSSEMIFSKNYQTFHPNSLISVLLLIFFCYLFTHRN